MDDTAFPKASQTPSRRPRMLILLVVGLLILGGIIFAGSRFLGTPGEEQEVLDEQDVVPTAVIEEVEEPTPTDVEEDESTSESAAKTPTPTTRPSANSKDSASGLDRKNLSIEVLNGSGTSGVAGNMSTFLKNLGYNVTSTGNADNFDYQGVSVTLKSSESEFLPLLKKDLANEYTVSNSSSSLASGSADAVIIVGK